MGNGNPSRKCARRGIIVFNQIITRARTYPPPAPLRRPLPHTYSTLTHKTNPPSGSDALDRTGYDDYHNKQHRHSGSWVWIPFAWEEHQRRYGP